MADDDLTIKVALGYRYGRWFIDGDGRQESSAHPADVLRLAEAIGPDQAQLVRGKVRHLADEYEERLENARRALRDAEERLAKAESRRVDAELLVRTLAPGES